MYPSGEAIFADARPIVAYEAGHIKNALHLEPGAAEELAERLTWLGYEKVFYLVDGWGQWTRHGLPVDPP
jgi:rhodanese-related sulfurtransferase